jgi:hypothetical protein
MVVEQVGEVRVYETLSAESKQRIIVNKNLLISIVVFLSVVGSVFSASVTTNVVGGITVYTVIADPTPAPVITDNQKTWVTNPVVLTPDQWKAIHDSQGWYEAPAKDPAFSGSWSDYAYGQVLKREQVRTAIAQEQEKRWQIANPYGYGYSGYGGYSGYSTYPYRPAHVVYRHQPSYRTHTYYSAGWVAGGGFVGGSYNWTPHHGW